MPPPLASTCVRFCQWEAAVETKRWEEKGRNIYPPSTHYSGSLCICRTSPSEAQIQFLRTTPSLCPFQLKMVMGSHSCQQDGTALSFAGLPAPCPSLHTHPCLHHSAVYPLWVRYLLPSRTLTNVMRVTLHSRGTGHAHSPTPDSPRTLSIFGTCLT